MRIAQMTSFMFGRSVFVHLIASGCIGAGMALRRYQQPVWNDRHAGVDRYRQPFGHLDVAPADFRDTGCFKLVPHRATAIGTAIERIVVRRQQDNTEQHRVVATMNVSIRMAGSGCMSPA